MLHCQYGSFECLHVSPCISQPMDLPGSRSTGVANKDFESEHTIASEQRSRQQLLLTRSAKEETQKAA